MEFPDWYPVFTWVLMGGLGTVASLFFTAYLWIWFTSGQKKTGSSPYSNFTVLGVCFLYASGLMACGIAGPPGYALATDLSLLDQTWIFRSASMSLTVAMIGWICMLIGQIATLKHFKRLAATKETPQASPKPQQVFANV